MGYGDLKRTVRKKNEWEREQEITPKEKYDAEEKEWENKMKYKEKGGGGGGNEGGEEKLGQLLMKEGVVATSISG